MIDSKQINNSLDDDIQMCCEKKFSHRVEKVADTMSRKINEYVSYEHDGIYKYKCKYPMQVVWKIVSECNLRCLHCFFHGKETEYKAEQDLPTEKVMQIIDEFANMNVISVTLTGGEGLLRKDIFEILKKLKTKNIAVSLSTNAILITKEIAQKLGSILNPVVDNIQVSIDGATAETHDKVRGIGAFEKTIQGINNLVEVGIYPSINSTATVFNISEMPEIYKLAQKIKAKKLTITRITPFEDTQNNLVPDFNSIFKYIAEVIRLERQYQNPVFNCKVVSLAELVHHECAQNYLSNFLNNSNKQSIEDLDCICHRDDKVYINADGNVYLCNLLAKDEINAFANVKNSSFTEAWEKRFQNVFFNDRKACNMVCKNCKYVSLCKGGCPAAAYIESGNIYAPDPNCIYVKKISKK